MKMQDKEFDGLFKAQLQGLEVEPSEGLWDKILPEIAATKTKKKNGQPFMQIAATLVVALAAGLLFAPRQQKVALHGTYNADAKSSGMRQPVTVNPALSIDTANSLNGGTVAKVLRHAKNNSGSATKTPSIVQQVDSAQAVAMVRGNNIGQTQNRGEAIKLNSPTADAIAALALKEDNALKPKPLTVATNLPVREQPIAQKKKIHGIGDLLNVVIAKVDKRDDKIIQFGSNDDDNDGISITGVNLGPIKVKKQE